MRELLKWVFPVGDIKWDGRTIKTRNPLIVLPAFTLLAVWCWLPYAAVLFILHLIGVSINV